MHIVSPSKQLMRLYLHPMIVPQFLTSACISFWIVCVNVVWLPHRHSASLLYHILLKRSAFQLISLLSLQYAGTRRPKQQRSLQNPCIDTTPCYILHTLWSPLNHLLTHVILVRVACGSNILHTASATVDHGGISSCDYTCGFCLIKLCGLNVRQRRKLDIVAIMGAAAV